MCKFLRIKSSDNWKHALEPAVVSVVLHPKR